MELVPLTPSLIDAAAATAAESFVEDPFYAWMFPTRTEAALRDYFTAKLTHELDTGGALTVLSPSRRTVLVAQRADGAHGEWAATRAQVLGRWVPRDHADAVTDVLEAIPEPAQPYVYLDILATAPAARGQGEGAATMRAWLRLIGSGLVHLDSSSPRNLPFYERLGFVAGPRVVLPHGAGWVTPMDLTLPGD